MTQFDHEKLNVYQMAIAVVGWVREVLAEIPKSFSVHNQLERASTSIPLNIAEGNGKFTTADRCSYFDNARGSALECAACIDVLYTKGQLSSEVSTEGKKILMEIVPMLVGLIKAVADTRSA